MRLSSFLLQASVTVSFALSQAISEQGKDSQSFPRNDAGQPHPAEYGETSCKLQAAYPGHCGADYDYTEYTSDQEQRANAVIEMFRFAWDGYYQYAYPHDDLLPVNNSHSDSRNGWGLLMIDALDTAIIMEQQDIVNIILKFVPTIDFTKNNAKGEYDAKTTSLFETNIRYLGGLLSSYDLLKGPFSHMASNDQDVDVLLRQATVLADTLKFAFDTPTGIPVNIVYIDNQTFSNSSRMTDGVYTAGLAELGTLVLEWQHLSDLTGDPSYGHLAQRAESHWFQSKEIWPGLTGGNFSVSTGEILDSYGGWTSGNDSAYEYLIKMYVYDPARYQNYSLRWQEAADSTIEHLLGHPSSRPDLTMAGSFVGQEKQNYSEQLAGGNFLLASSALNHSSPSDAVNQTKLESYKTYGLLFSEFCANGYRYANSGIGPTFYSWNTTLLDTHKEYRNQTSLYSHAGWFIPVEEYEDFSDGQCPEAVESWYYAYQTTQDPYWRDVAWSYTLAQNRTEKIIHQQNSNNDGGAGGFSFVNNVLSFTGDGTQNFMASYLLAEVFKYQYLIQTPKKGVWDVMGGEDGRNPFVFNTEAHPFRVAARDPV
ncbi:glycoside hydrolase family 47 [Lecanosticta acicola]|uniref:alpha-1,2-Mannosidase n=1 Tax=Lecanosticta acicola TaxID=111012 RepID=A0AAI9E8J9_9PEZI|nr:glycoside hydrolase family 47 [Lecanosticta acicola]